MSSTPVSVFAPLNVTEPAVVFVTAAAPFNCALTNPFSNPKPEAVNVPFSTTPSTNRNAPTLCAVFPSVNTVAAPLTVTLPLVNEPAPNTASVPAVMSSTPVSVFAPLNVTEPAVVFVTAAAPFNCALTNPFSNPKLVAVNVPFSTTPSTNRNAPTLCAVVPNVSNVAAPLTVTLPLVSEPAPNTASVPAVMSSTPVSVFAPLNVTDPAVVFVTAPAPFNCALTNPFSNPKLVAVSVPFSTTPSARRNAPTLCAVFPSVNTVAAPLTVTLPLVNEPAPNTASVPAVRSSTPVSVFAPLSVTDPAVVFVTAAAPFNCALTNPFSNPKLVAVNVPFSTTPSTRRNAPTLCAVFPSVSTVADPLTVTLPLVNEPAPSTASVPAVMSSTPVRVLAPLNVTVPVVSFVTAPAPFNRALTNPFSNPKLVAVNVPFSTTPSTRRNAPTLCAVFPNVSTVAAPLTVTLPLVSEPAPNTASVPAVMSSTPVSVFAPLNVTVPVVSFVTAPAPFNRALTNPFSNPKLVAVSVPFCTTPSAKRNAPTL
jgi:hypothetical protein